jgi:hypothetical protein
MKKTSSIIAFIVLCMTASAHAQSPSTPASEAEHGLTALAGIVDGTNHRTMGFDSLDEVRLAKLGDAIPVFMVRLDQLKRYSGEDGNRLLVDLGAFVYPVHVAGQVRTTVEVHTVNGKWEMTRVGGANRIRAMDKHRRNVMKATGFAASAFFEVRIPALSLTFLGHREGKALKLTPLSDLPSAGLSAGTPEIAEQVFARLVSMAQATSDTAPQ